MTKKNQHILGQSSDLHQLILLDKKGLVLHSCDALFPASEYHDSSILSSFPMIESIFSNLITAEVGAPPVLFSKVETFNEQLPGIYDYRFSTLLLEGQTYILWVIYDYTEVYEKFRIYQQKRNELEVHRQYFEQRLDTINSLETFRALKSKVMKNDI